jgi:DNA-directed RNA polymerase specialized sigma24 family protein
MNPKDVLPCWGPEPERAQQSDDRREAVDCISAPLDLQSRGNLISVNSQETVPMSPEGSVTQWLDQLQAGKRDAVEELWQRYWRRLVEEARRRLRGRPRVPADAEDVALSAFDTFCRSAENGRFPRLDDRDDLWCLLMVITRRKVNRLVERELADKRGGGSVQPVTDLPDAGDKEETILTRLISAEPSPDFAAEIAEEFERRLQLLPDPELRTIARLKMEGYTTNEIARELDRAPHAVARKIRRIRGLWSQETSS